MNAAPRYVNVRNAFCFERGTYLAIVDDDGTVRVWDSVAGHYTRCHSLTPAQIRSAQARAGWTDPATLPDRIAAAQREVKRTQQAYDSVRNYTTTEEGTRSARAAVRYYNAVMRLNKLTGSKGWPAA